MLYSMNKGYKVFSSIMCLFFFAGSIFFVIRYGDFLNASIEFIISIGFLILLKTSCLILGSKEVSQRLFWVSLNVQIDQIVEIFESTTLYHPNVIFKLKNGKEYILNLFKFEDPTKILYEIYNNIPLKENVVIAERLKTIITEEQMLNGPYKQIAIEQRANRKKAINKKAIMNAFILSSIMVVLLMLLQFNRLLMNGNSISNDFWFVLIGSILICYAVSMPIFLLVMFLAKGS